MHYKNVSWFKLRLPDLPEQNCCEPNKALDSLSLYHIMPQQALQFFCEWLFQDCMVKTDSWKNQPGN